MRPTILATVVVLAAALAGCAEQQPGEAGGAAGTLNLAGSSTVEPIALAWAEEFQAMNPDAEVTVAGGGSGSGFQRLCRGEIDIADASRPIKPQEDADCAANGIEPVEWKVAIDGLAVVVSKENEFVDHLTVQELNRIWTANESKQANKWSDLRPEWPDEEIELYGPGTNSGTFDYFVEAIVQEYDGKDTKGRSDYTASEDDNVLVQGVRSSPYALGYFGLAYAVENEATVRAVPIQGAEATEAVAPTPENVATGAYDPLSRPLFMYSAGQPSDLARAWFEYGLSDEGQALVEEVGYIPLPPATLEEMRAQLGEA